MGKSLWVDACGEEPVAEVSGERMKSVTHAGKTNVAGKAPPLPRPPPPHPPWQKICNTNKFSIGLFVATTPHVGYRGEPLSLET